MPFGGIYAKLVRMLQKLKKDINKELEPLMRQARPFLVPGVKYDLIYRGIKDFVLRNGKRIRPSLFVLSYLGYSKEKGLSYKKLVRCALSLELLHDFLLVHDDVIDNSALRRGKPSLHRLFNDALSIPHDSKIGKDLSIVAGDVMFAMAVETFVSFVGTTPRGKKALSLLTRAAAETGIGEYIDVANNIKDLETVTQNDVSLAYILKTAKYTFVTPLLMGAVLAGAGDQEKKKLLKLGITLGQGFQIHDDLLDVFSTSKEIGKPILSDLNESKKTLLVVKAYQSLRGKDKKELKKILRKNIKTYGDLQRFRKLIKIGRSDKYCVDKTLALLDEARAICSSLRMRSKSKKALMDFIQTMSIKTEILAH